MLTRLNTPPISVLGQRQYFGQHYLPSTMLMRASRNFSLFYGIFSPQVGRNTPQTRKSREFLNDLAKRSSRNRWHRVAGRGQYSFLGSLGWLVRHLSAKLIFHVDHSAADYLCPARCELINTVQNINLGLLSAFPHTISSKSLAPHLGWARGATKPTLPKGDSFVVERFEHHCAGAEPYIRRDHVLSATGRGKAFRALSAPFLNPSATVLWLQFLRTNDLARRLGHRDPQFLVKPLTRYLNVTYQFADRVRALISHYEFVRQQFTESDLEVIYFGAGITLAEFLGKSGTSYRVVLSTYSVSHNEGRNASQN